MNLATTYATLAQDVEPAKVVAYMRSRGHLSLLPTVLRILERAPDTRPTVTVAHERDAKGHNKDERVIVDPKIVGGTIKRNGSQYRDASYRNALVTLYKRIIN